MCNNNLSKIFIIVTQLVTTISNNYNLHYGITLDTPCYLLTFQNCHIEPNKKKSVRFIGVVPQKIVTIDLYVVNFTPHIFQMHSPNLRIQMYFNNAVLVVKNKKCRARNLHNLS